MAERSEREVLHHLVEVCKDGEHGFRTAAAHVSKPQLKALFAELANERAGFAAALEPHLRRLGDASDDEGSKVAALHRGWINFKSLVTGHNDHVVVTEAERGEQAAIDAYNDALGGMLPPTVTSLVEAQRDAMQAAKERIRTFDMGYT